MATTKSSSVAADEGNLTIAEQWLDKIDRPLKKDGWTAGIDHNAAKQMRGAAADCIPEGSPRYTTLYVFEDGSGIYEKRKNDWFIAEAETIAREQGKQNS
jgi:hypothetical protein